LVAVTGIEGPSYKRGERPAEAKRNVGSETKPRKSKTPDHNINYSGTIKFNTANPGKKGRGKEEKTSFLDDTERRPKDRRQDKTPRGGGPERTTASR